MKIDKETVRDAASGRWTEILASAGIPIDVLDGRHHPCPKCGGTNRFRLIDADAGAVLCNQCHKERNGDGFAAVSWVRGISFGESVEWIADYLGIRPPDRDGHIENGHTKKTDIIELVCRNKRMPPDEFRRYGVKIARRGQVEVARVDVYNERGAVHSYFDMTPKAKGWFREGSGSSGMFFPGRLPQPGEGWLLVEGVKDASALQRIVGGRGYVAGLPRSDMPAKFARLFKGTRVIIIPDRDQAGEEGAKKTAARLLGVAEWVKVAVLPGELKESGGRDVRDVIKADGEQVIRDAIKDAKPFGNDRASTIISLEGRTDVANAKRFAARFRSEVRWCGPWKHWFIWDGKRWIKDETGAIDRMAKEISTDVWREAGQTGINDCLQFAAKTATASRLEAMVRLARSEPDIPILPDELDADPWLLNCANGTIDLRTGDFFASRREDAITKLCPTAYREGATAPTWEAFLRQIFKGDDGIVGFIQRWFGYCLTGDVREQLLPIFHGQGSNGKSTLLGVFVKALGKDYAMHGAPEMLVEKKHDVHATERMDLFGMRFVAASETEDTHRLKEAYVKALTGGEKIRGRRLYEDPWEFFPTHKIVLSTNHKPIIKGGDHAIWRRLALVPFDVRFWNPEKDEPGPPELIQDKDLPGRLEAELEGILAWAVRGCLEWQESGLNVPQTVRQATSEYKGEQDLVGEYIRECCTIDTANPAGLRVKFSRLYDDFRGWCDDNGHNLPSRKSVGSYLKLNGYKPTGSKPRYYEGISLIEIGSADDSDDDDDFP